jgi:hypothetical protein
MYTTILGTGDANGDRTADLVASQADGNVFFYAGTAMRDEGYGSARKIGDYGWEALIPFSRRGVLMIARVSGHGLEVEIVPVVLPPFAGPALINLIPANRL